MKYFTADTHFGHKLPINKTIMGKQVRPFETVEEMNEALISNWNKVVSSKDEVYHLGDVSLCNVSKTKEILDRLNGKIYLISGNHEHSALDKKCIDRFEWVKPYHKFDVDIEEVKTRICLMHFPIACWDKMHYGAIHLHGHSHYSYLPPFGKIMDVGVDNPLSNYSPFSFDQIVTFMKSRTTIAVDHHSSATGRA